MVAGLVSLSCARTAKHRQQRVDAANEGSGYLEEDTDTHNAPVSPRTTAGALNCRTHGLNWKETTMRRRVISQ
uniref:Secreted protein n=1 Tax=Caenorhabditis tropicalis TaxID=1561998 RepID=A0A1I7TKH2_9PELO